MIKTYMKSVLRTWNTKDDWKLRVLNALLGLNGEVGEVTDIFKKMFFHKHDTDLDHIKKELGDVFYYLFALCSEMNLDPAEIMMINKEKLENRYPNGFDSELSKHRKEGDI